MDDLSIGTFPNTICSLRQRIKRGTRACDDSKRDDVNEGEIPESLVNLNPPSLGILLSSRKSSGSFSSEGYAYSSLIWRNTVRWAISTFATGVFAVFKAFFLPYQNLPGSG